MKTSASDDSTSAQKLASLLSTRKLSLYQVSRRSEQIYGRASPYFIPHNYYSELRQEGFSPSIHQLAALATISRVSLAECMRLFGIDVEAIPRLQVRLNPRRTQLLNFSLVDRDALVPYLRARKANAVWPEIAPLGRVMAIEGEVRIGDDPRLRAQSFLYAKIGCEDAWAFPLVVPGSIVRADPNFLADLDGLGVEKTSRRLFLIEHDNGFVCSQLRRISRDIFTPVSTELPFAEVELKHPIEARILGTVDLEIRPLRSFIDPQVPWELSRRWQPKPLVRAASMAQLLRFGRRRMRLSLSETQHLSRQVARYFRDRRYSISPSSLSDYEVQENPPRHLEKIITLCTAYGLDFRQVLELLGTSFSFPNAEPPSKRFRVEDLHKPDNSELEIRRSSAACQETEDRLTAILSEVPVFLRRSISDLSGIVRPALEDFYWIGGDSNPLHPALRGGVLAIVDRRRKKPTHLRSKLACQQPLFLLLKRSGGYLGAACSKEGSNLVVHPYPQHLHRSFQLRDGDQAEVVGQIVTVVRCLR